jgi:hypothetical protein
MAFLPGISCCRHCDHGIERYFELDLGGEKARDGGLPMVITLRNRFWLSVFYMYMPMIGCIRRHNRVP